MGSELLEIRDLRTHFFMEEGVAKALEGVSFDIQKDQVVGLVGESGCGKSVTAYSVLRILNKRARIVGGSIRYHSQSGSVLEMTELDPRGAEIRAIRGKEISMIFQEPMTSFSPVHTIGDQIGEAIMLHQGVDRAQAAERAAFMLDKVRIPQAGRRLALYPHEMSGGMRQRAMIAMALSCNPRLLIADEPTTALDVTIQAQILELLRGLRRELSMAILLITHNFGVIAEMADLVAVMYLGRIVEMAEVRELFHHPLHPYTQALLRSSPVLGKTRGTRLASIKGIVPDSAHAPAGCGFHPRCASFRRGLCDVRQPAIREVAPGHQVSCLQFEEDRP